MSLDALLRAVAGLSPFRSRDASAAADDARARDRVRTENERLRGVVKDATHRINTTLTSLQADALAVRRGGLAESADDIERSVRDISHALDIANVRAAAPRSDGDAEPRAQLESTIDGIMKALDLTLAERSIRWEKSGVSSAHVAVDDERLLELLGATLDLAVRMAHDTIVIETRHADALVELHVRSNRPPETADGGAPEHARDDEIARTLELITELARATGADVRAPAPGVGEDLYIQLTLPASTETSSAAPGAAPGTAPSGDPA